MKKYLALFLVLVACISCHSTKKDEANRPAQINSVEQKSPDINYREKIVVKGGDDKHVIYEYSDVRIDDVASLAIVYCARINPSYKANLRDIYMYKNHKRRATFDCECIAKQ